MGGVDHVSGLLLGLENGYAVASNDSGHDSSQPNGAFVLGHPDKVIDYGYRAMHHMTLDGKALVKAFYGVAPKHSYFMGCSLGGQQALTEAQRFPEDYDGVVVGAPAAPIVRLNFYQIWPALLLNRNPAYAIPREKSGLIQDAVMKACDELDGVKDGIIENPLSCRFDPATLECAGAEDASCLSAQQVQYMRIMYAGPKTAKGEAIAVGTAYGNEGTMKGGQSPMGVATALFQYLIFQDPNWDWKTLDIDRDIDFGEKVLGTVNPTQNANLKPFFAHGGKLLMYHGWMDGHSPVERFQYRDAVVKTVGPQAESSIRVFAVPGMGHCSGGPGCDMFGKLGTIDQWVETGNAPERIVASKLSGGKVIRTHPICAYPTVARYTGTGSTDDFANFACSK
jgi:feruloyl esterase